MYGWRVINNFTLNDIDLKDFKILGWKVEYLIIYYQFFKNKNRCDRISVH